MSVFQRHWTSLRVVCGFFLLSFLLGGCAQNQPAKVTEPLVRHSGVYGGVQPVIGAKLQLYEVGTTGDGSVATPLLKQPTASDADGNFDITGAYTCPSPSALVYITATGGNAGLGAGTNNTALALMAVLGPCGNLTASTFIHINELTTVAAVWSLAPFMSSYSSIGSGTTDAAALASAFTLASEYANTTTGTAPGLNVPAGTTVPVATLNTLANILSSCVNSAGGVAGDGSVCGTLFAAATPSGGTAPVEVIGAGLNIANNPTENVSVIMGLAPAIGAPFVPTLSALPVDWTVNLTPSSTTLALSIDPSELSFPDAVVGVASSAAKVTLTNIGTSPVALYGLSIIGPNAGDFAQSTSCPGNLASSATCTVQVSFTPLAIGARNAYLSVISSAPNSPQMISLSGSGVAGSAGPVTITPSTLNFLQPGDIRTVTLTNSGTTSLSIGAITLSSSNWTQTNNCGLVLDGQSVCTIAVTAGSSIGQFTGTLTVIDNDTTDAQTVQLTSDVRSVSVIDQFGNVIVGQHSFNIFRSGEVLVGTIWTYGGTLSGPEAGDFSADNNPCSAERALPCDIFMGFRPSAPGPRSAYFIDISNRVFLEQGFGLGANASFVFSPIALNFGNLALGRSTTLNLTVSNSSVVAISLNAPTLSAGTQNSGDFHIVSSGCTTLQASSVAVSYPYPPNSCTIQVRFTPTVIGPRSAMLTLSDSTGFKQQALITGQGIYPSPIITPSALQFGNLQTGVASSPQTVTVTLPNQDAAIANLVTSPSAYHLSQNTSCPRGTSVCQFTIVFNPSTTGESDDHLLVTDLATGYPSSIGLTGVGGIPVVSLSNTTLTYSPRSVGVTSVAQAITLTNNGNAPLTISNLGLVGSNPGDYSIVSNTCGSSVAVNASCSASVNFTPAATGTRSAILQIVSNATSSPDSVQLSGTGN